MKEKILYFLFSGFLLTCGWACPAQPGVLNIFSKEDSVFFYDGKNFVPEKLISGIVTDSSIKVALRSKIKESADTVLYKPLDSYVSGGMAEQLARFVLFLYNEGARNIQYAVLESSEKAFFGDISVVGNILKSKTTGFEPLILQPPTTVITKVDPSYWILQIVVRDKKLFYVAGPNAENKKPLELKPATTVNLLEVLNSIEKEIGISLKDHPDLILVKGQGNLTYTSFKIVKDAFKQKEIYKFKIVATAE